MAETTGKDTPATDPQSAVGKTGPVKPPVLEGTARPAGDSKPVAATTPMPGAKPADRPADKPADKPATKQAASPPPKPRTDESDAGSGGAWLAGLVGGLVGLGAAYGLAWFGLWPTPAQAPAPADPRLAQFATAIPELETVAGTVQDELSTLTGRVGALETAQSEAPSAGPVGADPAQAEEIAALTARLDELTASAGTDEGSEALATVQSDIAALRAEIAEANAQVAEARQQLASLSQSADESAGANAATVRLPLIFSGLESAFLSGRAYETELAALRQALPQTTVPEPVAARAADGLPRPDVVSVQLSAALPDMLAGRPATADATWQDATGDWFRGLIAMRPAGEVEGDGPDAMIARLEAAVERRDFVAAQSEFAALPQAMRDAAGSLAQDIDTLAAAQAFLADIRAQALNGEGAE
jgi:hypothetical protein